MWKKTLNSHNSAVKMLTSTIPHGSTIFGEGSVLISKDFYHEMITKSGAFTLGNMHSILDKYL